MDQTAKRGRGRPPKHGEAMTPADRQRLYEGPSVTNGHVLVRRVDRSDPYQRPCVARCAQANIPSSYQLLAGQEQPSGTTS